MFINLHKFIESNGLLEIFESLDEKTQLSYIMRIASAIQEYVNDKSYTITQLQCYNSQCTDHKISFKSEKVCKSAIFIKKKKYMLWCIFEDGYKPKENLQVTGLDTVRSNTPAIVKPMIKDVMRLLLTTTDKSQVLTTIEKYRKELYASSPEFIAENISVNNLWTYMNKNFICKKGTPRHCKGVAAYKGLVKELKLEGKADNIDSGDKVKVVYLKKNPHGIESISFIRWLDEFTSIGLEINYDKMIENNFISKLKQLLDAAGIEMSNTTNDNILQEWFTF